MIHAFDRQTDKQTDWLTERQTEFSSLDRVCILCSKVRIYRPLHLRKISLNAIRILWRHSSLLSSSHVYNKSPLIGLWVSIMNWSHIQLHHLQL